MLNNFETFVEIPEWKNGMNIYNNGKITTPNYKIISTTFKQFQRMNDSKKRINESVREKRKTKEKIKILFNPTIKFIMHLISKVNHHILPSFCYDIQVLWMHYEHGNHKFIEKYETVQWKLIGVKPIDKINWTIDLKIYVKPFCVSVCVFFLLINESNIYGKFNCQWIAITFKWYGILLKWNWTRLQVIITIQFKCVPKEPLTPINNRFEVKKQKQKKTLCAAWKEFLKTESALIWRRWKKFKILDLCTWFRGHR